MKAPHRVHLPSFVTFVAFAVLGCLFPVSVASGQEFVFSIDDATVEYDVDTGEGSFDVDVLCSEADTSPGAPNDTQAFQITVTYDTDFLTLDACVTAGEVSDLRDGDGPGFYSATIFADEGRVAVGCIYSLTLPFEFIVLDDNDPISTLTYSLVSDDLIDASDATDTELTFENGLGSPAPINNIVTVFGLSYMPEFEHGTITLDPVSTGPEFLRGDSDANGNVFVLVDALYILNWAFGDGDEPICLDAADVDDSGDVFALVDALALLVFGFNSGDIPPEPGPYVCGLDPTDDDDTDCETEPECP